MEKEIDDLIERLEVERLKLVNIYNRLGSDDKKRKEYKSFHNAQKAFVILKDSLEAIKPITT